MDKRETIKLISLLLQYPSKELTEINLRKVIQDIPDTELYEKLNLFINYFSQHSFDELTENYVHTFDFNEKTNLYLTYTKLKDEKERGQTLVELKQIYENEGFIINSNELPDYLPLFLEFISQAKESIIIELFNRYKSAIEETRNFLKEINSPYAFLLEANLLIINKSITEKVAL